MKEFIYSLDENLRLVNKGEIIRCKDCKYCDGDNWCERRKGEEFFVTDDFFCAGGERKETE